MLTTVLDDISQALLIVVQRIETYIGPGLTAPALHEELPPHGRGWTESRIDAH
jgi:hypothetical protein